MRGEGLGVPSGFPPTLEAFLDERLPQLGGPPDDDWIETAAAIYQLSPTEGRRAVLAWKPKIAPVVRLRPAARTPEPPRSLVPAEEQRTTAPESIYRRIVSELRGHGCVEGRGTKVGPVKTIARCPLHRDRRPSLNVTWNAQGAAIFCHSCRGTTKILALFGMTISDLCATKWVGRQERPPDREVARYAYTDLDGTVLAEKVRFEGKTFRFCRRGPNGDIWNLRGVTPGLYRWPDLIASPIVYIVEGEKAADQLWECGWPATCGPYGATKNGWWSQLSRDAWATGARTFIVFPDHDPAGAAHGEAIARTTAALAAELNEPLTIKVVQPCAGQPNKLNAVDWLLDGRSEEELQALIDSTAEWTPDWRERARRDRRRQQQREWVAAKRSRAL